MKTSYKSELLWKAPFETFDDAEPATSEQIRLFQKATSFLCARDWRSGQFGIFNKWGTELNDQPRFTRKYIQLQNPSREFESDYVVIYHYLLDGEILGQKAPNSVIELDFGRYERWETTPEGNTGYNGLVSYILIDDEVAGPHMKRLIEEEVHYPGYSSPHEARITIDPNDTEFSKKRKKTIFFEDIERMEVEAERLQKAAQLEDVSRIEMQNVLEFLWRFYHPKFVPLPPLSELIPDPTAPNELRIVS